MNKCFLWPHFNLIQMHSVTSNTTFFCTLITLCNKLFPNLYPENLLNILRKIRTNCQSYTKFGVNFANAIIFIRLTLCKTKISGMETLTIQTRPDAAPKIIFVAPRQPEVPVGTVSI